MARRVLAATTEPRRRTFPTSVSQEYLTDAFVSAIRKLSVRSKQLLMLNLYADENFFLERFVDFLVNPVIGKDGVRFVVDDDAPKTSEAFRRFASLNDFNEPQRQRELFRDAVLTGEFCAIAIVNQRERSKQLFQVHAPVIRQTIVDPGNYNLVAAVEMEQEAGSTVLLRVIDDENKFTSQGVALRRACQYECFLFQLRKRTHPTLSPYSPNDPIRKYEIRGEPFLMNSADLLQALVKYLWTSLDKADSWNRFNYLFNVDVDGVDEEEIERKIDVWRTAIGTPRPNSALYLPPHIKMEPVTFPMQSHDLTSLYRMFRNAAAWHSGTRETSMGEGDVKYASNEQLGISEPTIETKEILQGDWIRFMARMYDYMGNWSVSTKEIPQSELKRKRPNEYKYSVIANEISKRSQETAARAAKDIVETGVVLKNERIGTPESVNQAVSKKVTELLGAEVVPETENIDVLPENMGTVDENGNKVPAEASGDQEKQGDAKRGGDLILDLMAELQRRKADDAEAA